MFLITTPVILIWTTSSSNAQDTTWRDTCFAYPIIVHPGEVAVYYTPEQFGAVSNDGQDDADALAACFEYANERGGKIALTGVYDLFQTVRYAYRSEGLQTMVNAYGSKIIAHVSPAFDFGSNNPDEQIQHRINWHGGKVSGSGTHFKIHAAYQARFQDLDHESGSVVYDLKWVMGSIFENLDFKHCQLGFAVGKINTSYRQSTTINIRNCHWWTNNGLSFLYSDGAHGFKITNNIIEGNQTSRPFVFDMNRSGVGKLIEFRGNWFETPCQSAVTIKNANGTILEFSGNYVAEYVPVAIEAESDLNTTIKISNNHLPPRVRFHAPDGRGFWYFDDREQGHAERFLTPVPYHRYYTGWRFVSTGNPKP